MSANTSRARSRRRSPVAVAALRPRARKLAQQVAAEEVGIHLDGVARRFCESPMRFRNLPPDALADIAVARQLADDLMRGDARLIVGQIPDAADWLEEADKEKIGERAVHHLQIEVRRLRRRPIDDG